MAKAKYKRGTDGYFQTKVWDGTYNDDGSKHRITLRSDKSSRDLEKQVDKIKLQIANAEICRSTDFYFQEYAKHWRATKKCFVEKNTRAMYDNIINVHFECLADVKIQDICHSHLSQVIANANDKPRTCEQIYLTFRQIMSLAVSDYYITNDHYTRIFKDIDLPKNPKTEKEPLSELEKETLKACLEKDVFTPRERAYLTLIYYCGMRKQEALALTRFDFKFIEKKPEQKKTENDENEKDTRKKKIETDIVKISKVVIFDKNTPEIKPYPKSFRGTRPINLPAEASRYLKEYISSLPESEANLFSSLNNPLMTKSSYDKMWISILKKMNTVAGGTESFPVITNLTAHRFRHNYCSSLCYMVPTISISKIAKLMGDTTEVVLRVYTHVMEEKENVMEALEEALVI